MATRTLGTSATTSLTALSQTGNALPADVATLRAAIKWDGTFVNAAWVRIQAGAIFPGGYEFVGGEGLLHVPRRGVLKVLEGDYVGVDPNGWPILVSGWSINGGGSTGWTHT